MTGSAKRIEIRADREPTPDIRLRAAASRGTAPRMSRRWISVGFVCLLVFSVGCGRRRGGPTPTPMRTDSGVVGPGRDSGGPAIGTFVDFPHNSTGAAAGTGGAFNVSVTDITSSLACSMALDWANVPGVQGAQVFATFYDPTFQPCPAGTYGIDSTICNPEFAGATVPEECARYRRWDATGTQVADVFASGGAVTITDNGSACRIDMNLVFPGGLTFTHTLSLPFPEDPTLWCSQLP